MSKTLITLAARLCSWCGKALPEEMLAAREELRAEDALSEVRIKVLKKVDKLEEEEARENSHLTDLGDLFGPQLKKMDDWMLKKIWPDKGM